MSYCPRCGNEKKVKCPKCLGTSENGSGCSECDNTGEIICPVCHGK